VKILHCTDLHGHAAKLDSLADLVAGYDMVCITGDFLDLTDYEGIETQIRNVQTALDRIPVPAMLCSGNNDSHAGNPRLFQAAWLKALASPRRICDGGAIEVGRTRLRSIGWNMRLPTGGLDEIWLAHAPPASASTAINRGNGHDAGDVILGERCRAGTGPAIVLSGHQHEPLHWACKMGSSWSFNPGSDLGSATPRFASIDLNRRIAKLYVGKLVHDSETM
jgi:predicted phosphodiesterase